jgi:fermentation-respiration switch protein FrsA (DUF1100 family)
MPSETSSRPVPAHRLAPEHPFLAAIDDVLAAWRWLRTDQGLSARSIAVAGDSAGGGLAVADPKTPLASPLFASLAGLPPLLVQVGTADLQPRPRANREVPAGPGSLARQSVDGGLPATGPSLS